MRGQAPELPANDVFSLRCARSEVESLHRQGRAIETASLMLGSDKSRGYCLEMICADFLAGANLENDNPDALLQSALRFFQFLPGEQRKVFLDSVTEQAA